LKQQKIQKKNKNSKNSNKKNIQNTTNKKTSSINKSKNSINKNKYKKRRKFLFWTSIIIIITISIILFFRSSVFNIKEIKVENNSRISTEEIIQMSELKVDMNMFELSKKKIEKKIKEKNSYVESVKTEKNLNGTIVLKITERQQNYMLDLGGKFAYINNQGYILEISTERINVPTITGFGTKEIVPGVRLTKEDLEKLDTVIDIVEVCKSQNIYNKINSIDISDSKNFKLQMEDNKKTVNFGDKTDINEKVLWLITILKKEEGIEGEVYINNMDKIYFREKV